VEWTPMADIGRGLKNRSDGKKHPWWHATK
jgi:hypothetical protein